MKKIIGLKLLALALIMTTLTTDLMAATRITFSRGATSKTLSGSIAPGGARTYVIRLGIGQTFSINVRSNNGEVSVQARDIHGNFDEEYSYFETETDADGDHYITVRNNGGRTTRYTMTVSAY